MSIMQVGSKLVRTFGSGSNVKHVITETAGNKTYTRVVNSEGKQLANRVKEISRQNVGDKLVITRKSDDMQKDLVYDKKGKFLGMRVLGWFEEGKPANVLKTNSDYVGKWKYRDVNITDKEGTRNVTYSLFGKLKNGRGTGEIGGVPSKGETLFSGEPVMTFHNRNGIPIPHKLYVSNNYNVYAPKDYTELNYSLKEMVDGRTNAFEKGSGFEHLNYKKPKFDIMDYAKKMEW